MSLCFLFQTRAETKQRATVMVNKQKALEFRIRRKTPTAFKRIYKSNADYQYQHFTQNPEIVNLQHSFKQNVK